MSIFLDSSSVEGKGMTAISIAFIIVAVVIVVAIIISIVSAVKAYKKAKEQKEKIEHIKEKTQDVVSEKSEEVKNTSRKNEFCAYCWSRLNSSGVCPNCGASADWSKDKK